MVASILGCCGCLFILIFPPFHPWLGQHPMTASASLKGHSAEHCHPIVSQVSYSVMASVPCRMLVLSQSAAICVSLGISWENTFSIF